ncbi:MAG: 16S rRNA (cytosine(967)-C(5))-methyltransferase RsmB [Candidatus Thiodiazotropha sp.]|nr:16S rRNA (cytosine(967)-C(5))-methyltransferase RsmB [Candidatus Thiodiazotropha sp.]MCM8883443.1 16S rRNA (cytosine(967)-C(5))-methyltransferase RsmB [Candidatus Thiodiazotropha sp.]MCM8918996.1 16S rRNA (cytosine(967)-C(5))-methyltransferase RsmB [Candidatus Thiodiazotropha sp.]
MPDGARHSTSRSPRLISARIIQKVLAGRSLSELIPQYLNELDDSRDRGLVQAISYGVMRTYPRLLHLQRQLIEKPLKPKDRDIEALILIGLYQLLYLRVGDHAAVHETAGTAKQLGKRWAVGLVNGVLRSFIRQRNTLLEGLQRDLETHYAMPNWLLSALQSQWPDSWQLHAESLNKHPPLSIRVNQRLNSREAYIEQLKACGIEAVPIPVVETGINLIQAMDVTSLPGFTEGRFSVQDGAAQLAAELLGLEAGQQVLDACAAPGGKSCHILETESEVSLTALDSDSDRLQRVAENLLRLQLHAHLQQGDAANLHGSWTKQRYDRILLDVPCSATGVIRRHPDIKYLRRETDIPNLVKQQAAILDATWSLLKPGGVMLYATCSILPQENELQLEDFIARQRDVVEDVIDAVWGEPRSVGRQIAPGEWDLDGFFYARLVKKSA